MKDIQSAIVIGMMCFLLTIGIVIQVTSIKNESTVVAQENTEKELRDQVLKLTDEYNRTYSKLKKNEKKLEELRSKVSNANEQSKSWSNELYNINNCLGLTKLSGKGVTIKIKSENIDLLLLLNGLNNAGCDAIAINDNRITFNSEIKNDGDVVSVDGNVLNIPYEIKAIGGDSLFKAITMPGSYIDNLKNSTNIKYDVNVIEDDDIVIEKYNGIYNFNFMKNVEEQ